MENIKNKQRFDQPLIWTFISFSLFFPIIFLFCLCCGDMEIISFDRITYEETIWNRFEIVLFFL